MKDKKKTKELEWEKEFDKQFNIIYSPRFNGDKWNFVIKDFIQSLLTQQRTELLEEVNNEFDKCILNNSKSFNETGLIPELEIHNNLIYLLKKYYEK